MPKIQDVAKRISSTENKRKKLAEFLKTVKSDVKMAQEVERIHPIDIKIAAVDGGIVKRSVHGFDFVLARAVGVCFYYGSGTVKDVKYHPDKMPTPELFVMEALSDIDWVHTASIARQKVEIRTAIETVEKLNPDIILLDGSIIPHYTERPSDGSKVSQNYDEMIDLYKRLYKTCIENNVMLAGVIEDSRGTKFCDIVNRDILSKIDNSKVPEIRQVLESTRDTNLLYWILNEGERTSVFPYSDKSEHPVVKEFGSLSENIFSFYLKTVKYDRPIRIDFLGNKEIVEKLSSIILSISSYHDGYGIPSVLIEADQVAKLAENDIDNIYEQILTETGSNLPGTFRLRRDMRPF
ncbi:MAG: DNA double-strand break repair nuclease NurA [Candidatus Peribacteraceae bacterium]|nr:DNA double-strand break repair nuclease NurA [Candidatus Peribacteraceae bacterium]